MNFNDLVQRYEKPIYNLIYRLVGNRDEAADLTQDTFVAAYRSLSSFRGEASIYSWLYRIAVNKCKNKLKEYDKRRMHEAGSLDQTYESIQPSGGFGRAAANPQILLEQKELVRRIEQAIAELPSDYRIVVVLRDLHGLSYDEIGQAAELSVDVVRTRLARARAMLRKKIKPFLES